MPASADAGVFGGAFILLALAGVGIACLGALLPGRWAATRRVAEVLRSE